MLVWVKPLSSCSDVGPNVCTMTVGMLNCNTFSLINILILILIEFIEKFERSPKETY